MGNVLILERISAARQQKNPFVPWCFVTLLFERAFSLDLSTSGKILLYRQ